ncbi:hypothetical protein KKE06_00975 [Candidatus Micrarchaeota archaeon]|nr:hypothetical protein [Candidatus Micrarchaeota archaeon]MBU1929877.1 hypothetical protein [Candidatus Micrarchaeota archaeon]
MNRERIQNQLEIQKIVPEQDVLLEPLRGNSLRQGRFDFLVLTKSGKAIGMEVLSRPSQGKMKQKLSYAKEVDEFVFVLPSNCFELYRKKPRKGFRAQGRKSFFDASFADPKILVWLLNPKSGGIEQKNTFEKVFNTAKPVPK